MTLLSRDSDPAWEQLRPSIDESLHELGERDRQAIILRFFDGRTFAEIGLAMGAAENAARMRVDRALEKLRARLARRGITSTAAALGAALASQPVVAVPAELATALSAAPLAGAALDGAGIVSAWATLDFMAKFKLTSLAVMAVAAVASGTYVIAQQSRDAVAPGFVASSTELASLRSENLQLKAEVARLQASASADRASAFPELQVLTSAVRDKVIPPVGTLLRTPQGELSPAVAALFKLTPQDKAAFEETLRVARHRVDTLAAANVASVAQSSPTQVAIHIGTFAAEGGKAHDEFLASLRKTLGSERAAALTTLMGSNFDYHVASGFGSSERTLRIARQNGGPMVRYMVNEQVKTPGALQSFGSVHSFDRSGLEKEYPNLVKLLPADFLD